MLRSCASDPRKRTVTLPPVDTKSLPDGVWALAVAALAAAANASAAMRRAARTGKFDVMTASLQGPGCAAALPAADRLTASRGSWLLRDHRGAPAGQIMLQSS